MGDGRGDGPSRFASRFVPVEEKARESKRVRAVCGLAEVGIGYPLNA